MQGFILSDCVCLRGERKVEKTTGSCSMSFSAGMGLCGLNNEWLETEMGDGFAFTSARRIERLSLMLSTIAISCSRFKSIV